MLRLAQRNQCNGILLHFVFSRWLLALSKLLTFLNFESLVTSQKFHQYFFLVQAYSYALSSLHKFLPLLSFHPWIAVALYIKNSRLIKMSFYRSQKVLRQPKNLTAYSASPKAFVRHKTQFCWKQCVDKFLVWHKKFGPAQNILGPIKGQGNSA